MEISVLGSGNAFQPDGRAAQAILIQPAASGAILVDVGPSTLLNWRYASCATGAIDRVLFTHLHGDHIAGWPFLFLQWAFVDQRSAPVQVVGPKGVESTLRQLVELCYQEISSWEAFECAYRELEMTRSEQLDFGASWTLVALPMEHHRTSLGYRLEGEQQVIAISGDTAWCDGLEELAAGVDWLFVECTHVSPGPGNHLDLDTLRAKRASLGATKIVLVHLSDEVAAALAADPIPGVEASYDGWTRSLLPVESAEDEAAAIRT